MLAQRFLLQLATFSTTHHFSAQLTASHLIKAVSYRSSFILLVVMTSLTLLHVWSVRLQRCNRRLF